MSSLLWFGLGPSGFPLSLSRPIAWAGDEGDCEAGIVTSHVTSLDGIYCSLVVRWRQYKKRKMLGGTCLF